MRNLRRTKTERMYVEQLSWSLARHEANLDEIAAGRRGVSRNPLYEYVSKQLGGMFDHAEWYDWTGTRQPAGLIVHPYGHYIPQEVQAIAQRYGVRAQIFRPSWWHNPEGQTIVFGAPRDGPRKRGDAAAVGMARIEWGRLQRRSSVPADRAAYLLTPTGQFLEPGAPRNSSR
jgi:hypothetical protein